MDYSLYCIKECPIGKPISDNYLNSRESAFDAVFDMRCFINNCKEKGCRYQKELQEFDEKNS